MSLFRSYKMKYAFMYDNALSRVSKFTHEEKIMEWLPLNPNRTPIENPKLIAKIKLSQSGKQYNTKVDL